MSDADPDDAVALTERDEQFIGACRQGSWEMRPRLVAPEFADLDDTYGRRDGGWLRVHACVWPLGSG
jgi:hypothetical protein